MELEQLQATYERMLKDVQKGKNKQWANVGDYALIKWI